MTDAQQHSLDSARRAADRGELAAWVADFLSSPGSDNAPLAEQLIRRKRWWLGPVALPIDRLERLAGPSGDPVLCPVDEDYWRDDVDEMEERVEEGWQPPPVIVSYRDGVFALEDGNHRVESLRRAGKHTAWSVIAFESLEDRDAFEAPVTAE